MESVRIVEVAVPQGSSKTWGGRTCALVARVFFDSTISGVRVQTHLNVDQTGRLIRWKSGNFSRQTWSEVQMFENRWKSGKVRSHWIKKYGGPLVRACLRRSVHTLSYAERKAVNEYAKRRKIEARVPYFGELQ